MLDKSPPTPSLSRGESSKGHPLDKGGWRSQGDLSPLTGVAVLPKASRGCIQSRKKIFVKNCIDFIKNIVSMKMYLFFYYKT